MDALSKTTGVPVSLLQRVCAKDKLTMEETKQLNPVLYFLMQLYMCNTNTGNLDFIVQPGKRWRKQVDEESVLCFLSVALADDWHNKCIN